MERKVRKVEKKLERRKCVEHPRGRRNLRENITKLHTCRFGTGVLIVSEALERRLLTEGRLEADDEEDAKIPRMVLNYHIMSTRDAENGKNPVLAMKDESTGNRYLSSRP